MTCIIINLVFFQVHVTFTDKDGKITLEGPPEDVGNAEQILKNLTSELEAKLNYTELSVDHKYYKHIIGKSGSNGKLVINTM